jgi:hypothetical protein
MERRTAATTIFTWLVWSQNFDPFAPIRRLLGDFATVESSEGNFRCYTGEDEG